MARLELSRVSKRYGALTVVDDVSIDVPDGEFLVLLGPSGCGKTTTLRMVAGFVDPSEGAIRIGERDITSQPPWRRNAGLVFQSYALFPHMSVNENVAFGLEMRGIGKTEAAGKVAEALRLVRLDKHGERLPRQLSGGQQQRVALARALAIHPDVLLLDEPLSNLDAKLRHDVRVEIRDLQRKLGLTTIMVTHDQEEALTMADRLVVMSEGRIRQTGSQRDLYERPADRFVADFVGRSNFFEGRVSEPCVFVTHGGLLVSCAGQDAGAATFALRPERAALLRSGETADNVFEGQVEFVSYLGAALETHLRLSASERIMVLTPNLAGVAAPQIGETIRVGWGREDGRIFMGNGAAGAQDKENDA